MIVVIAAMMLTATPPGGSLAVDPATGVDAAPGSSAQAEGSSPDRMEPGLPGLLTEAEGPVPVVVQFEDRRTLHRTFALAPDLDVRYTFHGIPAVYALAPPTVVRDLVADGSRGVTYVEYAYKPVTFSLETATEASRAKEVWDPAYNPSVPPLTDGGDPVDGAGVGVALLDSGVDTTHPDFLLSGKIAANYLVTPEAMIDAPYHSPQNAHGTAMAGIVAGTGAASGGQYKGAAPGASIFSFNIQPVRGEVRQLGPPAAAYTTWAAIAMDWVLQHGHEQDPPIRVVNNAWHCQYEFCRTFNPDQVHNRLATRLAESGYLVTWAAGDFNPAGPPAGIVPEATNPTPGVLGVTAYDDEDLGVRGSCTNHWGNGNPHDPSTWPDVTAPGMRITTTWGIHADDRDTRIPGGIQRPYSPVTGTSAAAAHTAGVAALMLQSNPDLSPAALEFLLEDTATPLDESVCEVEHFRADPANPWSEANHIDGHGLVDAYAAVEAAANFTGLPGDDPALEEIPDTFFTSDGILVDGRFYLAGEDGLDRTRPTADVARTRSGAPNEAISFTSAPLTENLTFSGVDASAWIEVHWETTTELYGRIVPVHYLLTLEAVDAQGETVRRVVLGDDVGVQWAAGTPVERPFLGALPSDVVFPAGTRVRVTFNVTDAGAAGAEEAAISHWRIHWDGRDRPSHVGLGESAESVPPGGYADCRDAGWGFCGWIDADHPDPAWTCEPHGTFRVQWFGPPGSSATVTCYAATATCTVPGAPGDPWGSCQAFAQWRGGLGGSGPFSECSFEVPEGTPPDYHGKCEMLTDRV